MIIFDGENGSIQVSDVQWFVIEFTEINGGLVGFSNGVLFKLGYGIWVWN